MAQATKTMIRTAIGITVLSAFLFAIVRADLAAPDREGETEELSELGLQDDIEDQQLEGLDPEQDPTSKLGRIETHALKVIDRGRQIFRFATFGDQAFWGGALKLHDAIKGKQFGGVGPGLSPNAALDLGLKVDAEALPPNLINALSTGQVNLDDPAVTLELLRLKAVVGVIGFLDEGENLRSVGLTCAICHSVVDNSLAPGIGRRLDGWANRDLNVGAIVNLAPNLQPFADLLGVDVPAVKAVLSAWGPGKFGLFGNSRGTQAIES